MKIATVLPQPNVKEYQSMPVFLCEADLQSTVTLSDPCEHHATDIDKMPEIARLA